MLASYFDIVFAVNGQPHPGEKRLVEFAGALCPNLPTGMVEGVTAFLSTLRIVESPNARMQCSMVWMICYATHAFCNRGAARTSRRALVFSHPSWGGSKKKNSFRPRSRRPSDRIRHSPSSSSASMLGTTLNQKLNPVNIRPLGWALAYLSSAKRSVITITIPRNGNRSATGRKNDFLLDSGDRSVA